MATRFIEGECSAEAPAFVGHVVLCELGWVLESNYGLGRDQIARIIEGLLGSPQMEVQRAEVVWRALRDFRGSNIDFADHLLARVNQSEGHAPTVTFDRKAAKDALFELIQ